MSYCAIGCSGGGSTRSPKSGCAWIEGPMSETQPLLSTTALCKTYRTADRAGRLVLDHIDFCLREGEIVAILGKSGSGKSTFLRILAGLIEASGGKVLYRGQDVSGPARGVAMVFQSFALFP